jgi:hypothetical protein
MYGDILQKKAVDDDTVEYRRDSDQHKWCRGTVMREEKMMSFVYITYPEGRSVTTRERVGWKSERESNLEDPFLSGSYTHNTDTK